MACSRDNVEIFIPFIPNTDLSDSPHLRARTFQITMVRVSVQLMQSTSSNMDLDQRCYQ